MRHEAQCARDRPRARPEKGALQLVGVRWAGRAEGVSNQEIAECAFLSVKTVEATLMRVYRTPGAHSRSGLAHALAAAPPDATQA